MIRAHAIAILSSICITFAIIFALVSSSCTWIQEDEVTGAAEANQVADVVGVPPSDESQAPTSIRLAAIMSNWCEIQEDVILYGMDEKMYFHRMDYLTDRMVKLANDIKNGQQEDVDLSDMLIEIKGLYIDYKVTISNTYALDGVYVYEPLIDLRETCKSIKRNAIPTDWDELFGSEIK